MKSSSPSLVAFVLLLAAPMPAQLSKEAFQFHGFFSQGASISDHNNYLTMKTSQGSVRMTDGGFNLTWRINRKLRIGAQVYDRYIGDLGKGKVKVDWALVDYRVRDWLGFRLGKVKTPLGLFTDSQDQEFLYPWALLPQSVYPLDLRETNHAHTGGDVYGSVGLGSKGFISYQGYAGKLPTDYRAGFVYGIEDNGFRNVNYRGHVSGYDARWTTPVSGLMAGFSHSFAHRTYSADLLAAPLKANVETYFSRQTALYAEFARGRWRFDGEYRASKDLVRIRGLSPSAIQIGQAMPGWFAAVSYRISPRVEIGTYRSHFNINLIPSTTPTPGGDVTKHIYDSTVAIRLDPRPYWNIKLEGHLMDGIGNSFSARGFYSRYHPQGVRSATRMLVIRTGFNF
jgi:hypothetical protein